MTWSELAANVQSVAGHLRALGFGPGDALAAVGALSPAFLTGWLAVRLLGGTLVVADPDLQDPLLSEARFVLADSGHDLERVLRAAHPRLVLVTVADGAAIRGESLPGGGSLRSFDTLVTDAPAVSTTESIQTDTPALKVLGSCQVGWLREPAQVSAPTQARRVLAEMDTTWTPGLSWLLSGWLGSGTALVLPEPGGDAQADRTEARADAWLVQPERLNALTQDLSRRLPTHGWAASLVSAVLDGDLGLHSAWARRRLRRALGLATTRVALSPLPSSHPDLALLRALGVSTASTASSAPVIERGASVQAPGLADLQWAGGAS